MVAISIIFLTGLCIGSFINVLSYRITFDQPFFRARSRCTFCHKKISWYDNIPLLSWFILRGKCRNCSHPISFIYPLIELLSAIVFTLLCIKIFAPFAFYDYANIFHDEFLTQEIISNLTFNNIATFFSYLIAFIALIASIRSDLEAMVIPQIFSIWLMPLGIICAFLSFIKIDVIQSIIGATLGYGLLWGVGKIFYLITNQEGIGIGDMELLSMIGSFFGPIAVFTSLLIGSISGVLIGGIYLFISGGNKSTKIPFGPFLSIGTIIYFFFENYFLELFF